MKQLEKATMEEQRMTERILVIEDGDSHIMDAKKFFESRSDLEVTYAKTYDEASQVMFNVEFDIDIGNHKLCKTGNIDGVISDIYFQLYKNSPSETMQHQPEPIGVRVAIELSQLGIPFVLNTAGYHHGVKYEWINQLARFQGWDLIDSGNDYYNDSYSKDWKSAYEVLKSQME